MSRFPSDETEADPLGLLAQYRRLCEAAGAAAAAGTPLPRSTQAELARLEGELRTRLWLVGAQSPGAPARKAPPAKTAAAPLPLLEPAPNGGGPASPSQGRTATVFSDGACIGNPGPGGYAALVRVAGGPERAVSGGKARTTNNEMEMTAAIEGLKLALSQGAAEITVVSDSEYLVKGMTSWVRGWQRNGWKTRSGEPVKNRALWEELIELCRGRAVTWTWTRAHAGQPENERCDAMAVAAAEEAARGR